jgi:superfamily II DNA or RNA helicase
MNVLRPYQVEALARVEALAAGGARRVLLVSPTGSGKTTVASALIAKFVAAGKRVLFLAHRREIIDQTYKRLLGDGFAEADVGVLMAADARRRPTARIQIASIDTYRNRARPAADLVIIDEAHRSLAKSYRATQTEYPNALHVGLTATPFRADGRGLGEMYDALVVVATVRSLIEQGYLVNPRVLGVPSSMRADLSGVRLRGHDYDEHDLARAVNTDGLVGNVVEHWMKHAAGVRTVAFAVCVEHSKRIVERFRAAGVAAEHLDANTPIVERDAILARLGRGETRIVSNVGVLCLDDKTEILTKQGWVGIDDMRPTHEVAGWSDGMIVFEPPLEVVRRQRLVGERMVSVKGRSVDLRVTEGHGVVYRTAEHTRWMKRPARERVGAAICLPAYGRAEPCRAPAVPQEAWSTRAYRRALTKTKWNVRHLEGLEGRAAEEEAAWRVARKACLEHKMPSDLSLDECRFIGFFLGDGSKQRLKSGGVEYRLFESRHNPRIVAWIDALVARLGLHVSRRELKPHEHDSAATIRRTVPCIAWSFARGTGGGSQARDGVYHLEPYLEREGSDLYWSLDDEQFRALLHGLWMADGNHGPGADALPRSLLIHNARRPLLDRIQAIAACRGFRTRVVDAPKGMRILRLIDGRHHELGKARLHFEDDHIEERVWCVRTRAGNIVTRRNGAVVVLGNCEGWDMPAVKCAILARPTKSTALYLQQAGRILRPWTDPGTGVAPRALILDHAGCADEHGLPQDDRAMTLDVAPRAKRVMPTVKLCPSCHEYAPFSASECACGHVFFERQAPAPLVESDGELVEKKAAHEYTAKERYDEWKRLRELGSMLGYREGWAFHRFKERFGVAPPAVSAERSIRLFTSIEEKRAHFAELTRIAKERGYKPGYAYARYRQEVGEPPPPPQSADGSPPLAEWFF